MGGGQSFTIFDIEAKILMLQCNGRNSTQIKPISIIPEDLECYPRDLALGSVKTRFKAIFKKCVFSAQIDFSAHIYFFHVFLPPEGDLSAQIYFFNELLPPEGDFSAHIYVFK